MPEQDFFGGIESAGGFFGDVGSNARQSYLAEYPRETFFGHQNQFGKSPAQRNFISNQFGQIYDKYLGNVANQVRSGTGEQINQSGTFDQFLSGTDFNQSFQDATPYERGATAFRNPILNPNTRFLFNY